MKTYCLTLDLKDDPGLIRDYLRHHRQVWPEVIQSIENSGIRSMEIYHVANRLVMTITTTDKFSFEEKARKDASDPRIQEWESLMDQYQKRLPYSDAGEKWVLMNKIFDLKEA